MGNPFTLKKPSMGNLFYSIHNTNIYSILLYLFYYIYNNRIEVICFVMPCDNKAK